MQNSASNVTEIEGGFSAEEKKLRWKIDNFNLIMSDENSLKQQKIYHEFKDSKGVEYKSTVNMCYGKPKKKGYGNEEATIPIELYVNLKKQKQSGKPGFKAQCAVVAKDASGREVFRGAPNSDLQCIWRRGYAWDLLKDSKNRNLVKGALTITLTYKILSLKGTSRKNANDKHLNLWKHEVCSKIAKLENDDKNSDVKIVSAEGRVFFAYRWILSQFSDVFDAMFRSDMVEKETGVVKLDDLSEKTMGLVLHFIYAGEIGNDWPSPDIIEELVYCADKYQIKQLRTFLDSNLETICTVENAGNLLALAERMSMKKAANDVFAYIKRNVTDSQKFLELV